MRVVSTVHRLGWESYGQAWADSVGRYWDAEAILYEEGGQLMGSHAPNLYSRSIDTLQRCVDFKAQYQHYKPVLWQWDIVRWSNKVFANYDALIDYAGLAVWLDCDTVTKKPITEDFIRGLLPEGHYMSMFKRSGMPTETGFVIRDCSHPMHKVFMETWVKWLESGSFKQLDQWCDASTMDATTRLLEKQGLKTASLSGGFEKELSPMDHAFLSEYITHNKGSRKWRTNQNDTTTSTGQS